MYLFTISYNYFYLIVNLYLNKNNNKILCAVAAPTTSVTLTTG